LFERKRQGGGRTRGLACTSAGDRENARVSATGPTARAVRLPLAGSVPAAWSALLVAGDPHPVALTGRWAGVAAIVAGAPTRIADQHDDPFALLDDQPAVDDAPPGFVGGGWFGLLGYGLGHRLERLPAPPPRRERLPDVALAFYDHVLVLDRDGHWWFEALWTPQRAAALETRREALARRLDGSVGHAPPTATGPFAAEPTTAGHARAVAACRERIAAGDLFQANLALRLRAPLDGDPVGLFCRGVTSLAPDRAAYIAGPWGAIASLSPELFVARHGDTARSAPIKGTRPRPADPAAAAAHRDELAASAKDRAENTMIVDLVRNDLGRVCLPGSVRVEALADVRAHAGVWHLVSEVAGRRRPGVGDGELVAALFPPGSVTGAPKVAAMTVISELESAERQAFCGAIGFASPTAGLELSVAIRTFESDGATIWLDVGGGVVADSEPDGEAAECLAKARPLLDAVGATPAEDDATVTALAPPPPRLGPRPLPRPDPAAGIFETLLVRDGAALHAADHLERLARSAAELYDVGLPAALPALVDHASLEQGGPCRLRVLLDPDGTVTLEAAPLPAPVDHVTLAPVTLPGGLGVHKWRDRRLVDALQTACAPALPLLVDLDGRLLETTYANVFVQLDGRLITPPADGRIRPGVLRGRLVADGDAVEATMTLADLDRAEAILVGNALRGLVPALPVPAGDAQLRTDRW